MTTIETTATTIEMPRDDFVIDDAQLAAVAFLARYSGRTLDAYRHDLRGFFQWAADNNLAVLEATRPPRSGPFVRRFVEHPGRGLPQSPPAE